MRQLEAGEAQGKIAIYFGYCLRGRHSSAIDITEIKKSFGLHVNFIVSAWISVLLLLKKSQFRKELYFKKLLQYCII